MASDEHPPPPKTDAFATVVVIVDRNATDPADYVRDVHAVVSPAYTNYEIIVVDNGVDPATRVALRKLTVELPCIRLLRLSQRVTPNAASFAGLDNAIGDFVVVLQATFDPVGPILEILELLRGGKDVVEGMSTVPTERNPVARLARRLFYAYNRRYLSVDIPAGATYLTGLTRRALNAVTSTTRSFRYLRHLVRYVGFEVESYSYEPASPRLHTRTAVGAAREAIEMVSSYSLHPLRFASAVGVIAALLNLFYAIYVVVVAVLRHDVAAGWTTTSLQLAGMFFILSGVLAIIAEYIGRVLRETRREVDYFIAEELESDVLIADLDRRNVTG